MKRGHVVIISIAILFLVLMPLASANVFTNFWNQITGQDILPPSGGSLTTNTTTCGNGVLNSGEICDYAAPLGPNNAYGSACTSTCSVSGTSNGWYGCRGSGVSVCSEKVTAQYYIDHPLCLANSDCAGQYYQCNYNYCPPPVGNELANPYICNETDGGLNYGTKGTAYSNAPYPYNSQVTDYCSSSSTLQESFCESDGLIGTRAYVCQYGCLNGACENSSTTTTTTNNNNATVACTDSDNSPDYTSGISSAITPQNYPDLFTPGIATGDYQGQTAFHYIFGQGPDVTVPKPTNTSYDIYVDYCANSQQLNEGYCDSKGNLEAVGVQCPLGCLNGVCIANTNSSNQTVNVNAKCLDVTLQAVSVVPSSQVGSYSVTLSRGVGTGNNTMGGIFVRFYNSSGAASGLINFPALNVGQTLTQTLDTSGIGTRILNANQIGFFAYFYDSSGQKQACSNTEMFSFNGVSNSMANVSCRDSDGGTNLYVQGTMVGSITTPNGTSSGIWIDHCLNSKELEEYSCTGGLALGAAGQSGTYDCPNGCSNGACIPSTNIENETEASMFSKCGNGVLNSGEICDYAAPLGPNNAYGTDCNSLCEVSGTTSGWLGCRGTGISVCTDKVNTQYYKDHPLCLANADCEGLYGQCNNNYCPSPTANETNTNSNNETNAFYSGATCANNISSYVVTLNGTPHTIKLLGLSGTEATISIDGSNLTVLGMGNYTISGVSFEVAEAYNNTIWIEFPGFKGGAISLSYPCTGAEKVTIQNQTTPTQTNGTATCQSGCILDGKCYPIGYRASSSQYCSPTGVFTSQLQASAQCNNNFECTSNVCVSHQCVSQTLIQKIIAWFQSVFG